jgi:MYXO-CTERM domain-containing protein
MSIRSTIAAAFLAPLALAASYAGAFTFTLTPVTNTTSNFAGTIAITGVVTVAAGETFYSPLVMSTSAMPFNATLTAGFNGPGQNWDAGFLAWNGIGTYSGAIFNHVVTAANFGYAGGMPLGLYGTNPFGPSGGAGIILHYVAPSGADQSASANYAINVIPTPGPVAALALAALAASRRRR